MDQIPSQVQNGFNLNPTIQTLTFSDVPVSGSFVIKYQTLNTVPIYYNASLQDIQNALNTVLGINSVTVTGGILTGSLVIQFNTVSVPGIFTISTNTLQNALLNPVTIAVTTNLAQGKQLDTIGKYVGVSRTGFGKYGPIVLTDQQFLQIIRLGIINNNDGSSLADIQNALHLYFPGHIQVFDFANTSPMRMGYLIDTTTIDLNVLSLIISENLLPKPMGVGLSANAAPTITTFFGFCDYAYATPTNPNTSNSTPFQCFTSYTTGDYDTDWLFMDYSYSVLI
jgi:hypothetical protein